MKFRPSVWAALGILVCLTALAFSPPASAQQPSQVAVVIQFGDGTLSTHCVTLSGEPSTGLEALLDTGLPVIYEGSGGLGARVCKIGPEGCDDPGQCFCRCQGSECLYWSYWHRVEGVWQYSIAGSSLYKVSHGTVEGWTWGIGTPQDAPKPPEIEFDEICAPAEITPMPTQTETVSPPTHTPQATATRRMSTGTPAPSPTATEAQRAQPAQTPSPTPPTQPTTQTTILVPNIGAPAPERTEPSPARGYVVFGIIAIVLVAGVAFVWRGKKR